MPLVQDRSLNLLNLGDFWWCVFECVGGVEVGETNGVSGHDSARDIMINVLGHDSEL